MEEKIKQIDNVVYITKQPIECQLLDVDSFCQYLNIGKTTARKMLKNPDCTYSMKIGNRWYAHKEQVDKWLKEQLRNK